jgi:hypothetical protein
MPTHRFKVGMGPNIFFQIKLFHGFQDQTLTGF